MAVSLQAPTAGRAEGQLLERVPPASFFFASAVFHYLGPSLAVLLFAHGAALGVMWLRIATAAVVFATWRRPWRALSGLGRGELSTLVALGVLLAVMNSVFYLAVARLPLATVGAIEFLGTVVLRASGTAGIDLLAASMLVAAVVATPVGAFDAGPAFAHPSWLLWGAGVGICSSVVPM